MLQGYGIRCASLETFRWQRQRQEPNLTFVVGIFPAFADSRLEIQQ